MLLLRLSAMQRPRLPDWVRWCSKYLHRAWMEDVYTAVLLKGRPRALIEMRATNLTSCRPSRPMMWSRKPIACALCLAFPRVACLRISAPLTSGRMRSRRRIEG